MHHPYCLFTSSFPFWVPVSFLLSYARDTLTFCVCFFCLRLYFSIYYFFILCALALPLFFLSSPGFYLFFSRFSLKMLPSYAAACKSKDKAKVKCFFCITVFSAGEDWYIYCFNTAVKGSKDALKVKSCICLPVETIAIDCSFSDTLSACCQQYIKRGDTYAL